MALRGEDARRIWRSAVAVLRSSRAGVTAGQLARRLIDINGQIQGQAFAAYQGIARQAIAAVQAAERVMARGALVFPTQFLPRAPGMAGREGGFLYRILVTVTDPATGAEVRYAADYYSPLALSYAQIEADAAVRFASIPYRTSTRQDLARIGAGAQVQTQVLAVGTT